MPGVHFRCTGAAGRAGSEINIVRRGPVNPAVMWWNHALSQRHLSRCTGVVR